MRRAQNADTHALKQHRLSQNISPVCSSFFYWLSHKTCISSLHAKNERKTLIFTQLKMFRYRQHFFTPFKRILLTWPLNYLLLSVLFFFQTVSYGLFGCSWKIQATRRQAGCCYRLHKRVLLFWNDFYTALESRPMTLIWFVCLFLTKCCLQLIWGLSQNVGYSQTSRLL